MLFNTSEQFFYHIILSLFFSMYFQQIIEVFFLLRIMKLLKAFFSEKQEDQIQKGSHFQAFFILIY